MTLLLDSALKISVVLGVALLATVLLRNRSASIRHWMLSASVLCAAVVPFATLVLPAWNLSPEIRDALPLPVFYGVPDSVHANKTTALEPPLALGAAIEPLAIVWFAGSVVGLCVLATGFIRLLRVGRHSRQVKNGEWARVAEAVFREYGLRRRVCLLQSESPAIVITWGALRPKILLPQGMESWPEECIRVVLHHELAHVRRNDWLIHTLAETLRAVYWFNPLMWVVCRRLRLESEYAADDAVLARGFSGHQYAAHLLQIVRSVQQPDRAWSSASAMARTSTLERRFSAMLNLSLDRRPLNRLVAAAAGILLLGTSLSLAALRSPAAVQVARPEGSEAVAASFPIPVAPVAVSAPVPATTASVASPARVSQPVEPQQPQLPATAQAYKGEVITLDLTNADIRDFFRLIADLSRLNVVVDPDVTGQITLQLKDVPWDQALDIVLENRRLVGQLQGNVLRILSRPGAIPQEQIVLDFEVLQNGQRLGRPRIATGDRRAATLSQGTAFAITVTPTQIGRNRVELELALMVGTERFAATGLAVARDAPAKATWETGGNSFEVRITLATP